MFDLVLLLPILVRLKSSNFCCNWKTKNVAHWKYFTLKLLGNMPGHHRVCRQRRSGGTLLKIIGRIKPLIV